MYPLVSDGSIFAIAAVFFCIIGAGFLLIALFVIRRPKKKGEDEPQGDADRRDCGSSDKPDAPKPGAHLKR